MSDMHFPVLYTSREITHDCKLMRFISGLYGTKIFALSLSVPQFFDMYVGVGRLLYYFHVLSFKLLSLFLRRQCLND